MPGYGSLTAIHPAATIVAGIVALFALGYVGAPLWVWTAATAALLWGLAAPVWLWVVFAALALLFNVRPLRRIAVTTPIMKAVAAMGLLPKIGDTERVALEAGTTWVEGEFFTGRPDFDRILGETYPELTEEERAFLEGPVEQLCRMTDDWEIRQRNDLSAEVWDFIRRERFLGMVIPEEHGGLGFSANGMRAVVAKLGSRSVPLAVDVMVPNSLGPAELLVHYGTEEQKERWLPGLARGEEIPCFALTEPDAGSDAASIDSEGVVFRGDDGELKIRLNWEKRYITLAAVATVHGLAFQLKDPENLLGRGEEPGITCGLIPTDREGVRIGRRHDPLRTPFINSPTEGRDVVVGIDAIIGGPEQAGNGWRMLMETLAGGRGIFLPALNGGGDKLVVRAASAYAVVRRQFGVPIGRFEGVQELLAPIGGLTWLLDAYSTFTCGGLDEGKKPAVVSAIVKYHAAECNRVVLNNAMDILGGKGIALGPSNVLGYDYVAVPIAITVEGSNVVTRSLIIFGQGLIRSHPYAFDELTALEEGNVEAFDRALWSHVGMLVRNLFRAKVLMLSRGALAGSPVSGPTAGYYRRLAWASATFALMSDLALFGLGGALKRKERISGRFADVLSWQYLAVCALRKWEADGRPEEQEPFLRWSVEHALWRIQEALMGIYENFPVPVLGWILRGPVAAWSRLNPIGLAPSDELGREVAEAMMTPGPAREALVSGTFLPEDEDIGPLSDFERAFRLAHETEELFSRIRAAIRDGTLEPDEPKRLGDEACRAGVFDEEECERFVAAEEARREVVAVDAFDLDELPVQLPAAGPRPAAV